MNMKIKEITWQNLPWKEMHIEIYKLQKQIYYSSMEKDTQLVWKLQNRLIRLQSAKLLAVRRVTQDNRGKNTAGVDKVKSLTPIQRIELAQSMVLDGNADPIRRVFIPKSTPGELRTLGIPTGLPKL